MAITKPFSKESIILFLFLAFLPFGQILRVPVGLGGVKFYLNVSDVTAVSALVLALFSKPKFPRFWKAVTDFLIVVGFSLIASLSFFAPASLFLGLFYFVRLISYFYLFAVLWNFLRKQKNFKETVFRALMLSSGFIALFGWLQYLFYPDLRSLLYVGWDEHLLRMVGGFLDPTFTGILLVFGAILATLRYFKKRKKETLIFAVFLLISLAFTYSRSSYLALGVAIAAISLIEKKFREGIFLGIFFALTIFFLPKGEGEGVKLERTASIAAKIQNYRQSLALVKVSPIFGIGYNNVCLAKQEFLGEDATFSHACSGLDASLLYLLATSGILGIFSFTNLISVLVRNVKKDIYGKALLVSGAALLVHSLFANSLFYSWVMGTVVILLSLGL